MSLCSEVGKTKIFNLKDTTRKQENTQKGVNPLKIERNLFAKFIIISRSSRTIDIKEIIGEYDTSNFSICLTISECLISCTDKSKIASEL